MGSLILTLFFSLYVCLCSWTDLTQSVPAHAHACTRRTHTHTHVWILPAHSSLTTQTCLRPERGGEGGRVAGVPLGFVPLVTAKMLLSPEGRHGNTCYLIPATMPPLLIPTIPSPTTGFPILNYTYGCVLRLPPCLYPTCMHTARNWELHDYSGRSQWSTWHR